MIFFNEHNFFFIRYVVVDLIFVMIGVKHFQHILGHMISFILQDSSLQKATGIRVSCLLVFEHVNIWIKYIFCPCKYITFCF
jgi:hypothetical protein